MSENQTSQERILQNIKAFGPQTAKALAGKLEMTTMGTRQHLALLESKGLVSQTAAEKRQRGRPVRRWQLTSKGHEHFPDMHNQLVGTLISAVRELFGDEGLQQLIDKRAQDLHSRYRAAVADSDSLREKVEVLASLRTGGGYMADVLEEGDGVMLVENHCPIFHAARAATEFCHSELATFQKLLRNEASVERSDHIIRGQRRCAYRITPK